MKHCLLKIVVVLILCSILLSCASDRTALPVVTRYHSVHSASQQEVLSRAVDMAVDKLSFSDLKGKTMHCQMAAVLSHSDEELNNYILMRVEAKLAEAGGVLSNYPDPSQVYDYTCKISISTAGADITVVKETASKGRIAANAFLQFPTLFTSWFWYPINIKTRNYVGRARISVNLLPQKKNLTFAKSEGEGEFTMPFDGEDVSYYPVVEGTAYERSASKQIKHTNTSKSKVVKEKKSSKVIRKSSDE